MFAKIGEYEPCGIFTTGHLVLIIITVIGIIIALKCSQKKTYIIFNSNYIYIGNNNNNFQCKTKFI